MECENEDETAWTHQICLPQFMKVYLSQLVKVTLLLIRLFAAIDRAIRV